MGSPITWRNVNGPSLAEASRPMEVAQRTISGAFDGFKDIIKGVENTDAANWQTTKANNTDEFLTQARSRFNTPEEWSAAIADGTVDNMRKQYGAQINQEATRNFMENQLGNLQGKATTNINFANAQRNEQAAPIRNQFMQRLYSGDTAGAEQLLKANPELRLGDLQKNVLDFNQNKTAQEQQAIKFGFEQARAERDAQMFPLELQGKRASNGLINAQANGIRQANENSDKLLKAAQAAEALAKKNGDADYNAYMSTSPVYSMGVVDTKEGYQRVTDHIDKMFKNKEITSGESQVLKKKLADEWSLGLQVKGKNGKLERVPMPVKTLIESIDSAEDNMLSIGFSRREDVANNILNDRMNTGKGSNIITSGGTADPALINEVLKGSQIIANRRAKQDPLRTAELLAATAPTVPKVENKIDPKEQAKINEISARYFAGEDISQADREVYLNSLKKKKVK